MTLLVLLGVTVAFAGLISLVTSPVAALLGDSRYAIPDALHGVTAILYVITATISAYLAYRLFFNRLEDLRDLRVIASLNACLSLLTVIFGNWIYIYYRDKGGPRGYFLETRPVIHEIFFEFKEFIALFTLPMFLTATYILWRYGKPIVGHREARAVPSILILLGFAFLLIAYVLGAAITKLRGV